MRRDLLERVESDPEIMLGKPVIRGTRVTVEILLEKLAADIPIEEILEDYPFLSRQDILAALAYARQALGTVEIVPALPVRKLVPGEGSEDHRHLATVTG